MPSRNQTAFAAEQEEFRHKLEAVLEAEPQHRSLNQILAKLDNQKPLKDRDIKTVRDRWTIYLEQQIGNGRLLELAAMDLSQFERAFIGRLVAKAEQGKGFTPKEWSVLAELHSRYARPVGLAWRAS
jgi:hypothetical protein